MEQDKEALPKKTIREAFTPGAIIFGLVMGVLLIPLLQNVGSHLVYWLAKLLTLGSHVLRDSMYKEASRDPTGLTAPLVILVAMIAALWPLRHKQLSVNDTPSSLLWPVALGIMVTALCGTALRQMFVVEIWRTLENNLARCAPFLETSKQVEIRADVASMTTRPAFENVLTRLIDGSSGRCEVLDTDRVTWRRSK